MFTKIKEFIRLIGIGMQYITMFPETDYTKHISSVEELTAKSWQMTGDALRKATDEVGACFIKDDGEALRSDWQAVGNDLRQAMNKI